MKPHTHLAVRAGLTATGIAAFVVAGRLAYENANTAHVIAAGVTACMLLATFSLLLSAALGYGWQAGRAAADARYAARLTAEHPLGPIREHGYHVKDDEPNAVFEEMGPWRPIVAATEAADNPDDWAQLLAADTVDEADGLYTGRAA